MSLSSLTLSETKFIDSDLEPPKSLSISFNNHKESERQDDINYNLTNAIFCISTPSIDYSSSISDIISTAPTSENDGLTLKSRFEKAKIKANSFLSSKTVTLKKHLDAYGVIDTIVQDDKDNGIKISARIYNIVDHEFVDEIIFLSKEFSESDQRKLVENAIFYWHVGVEKNIFGREKHVSEFRLRRVAKR